MVTPGAAPLIVYAFRRVRRRMSTEAVPDRRRRTRRSPSTIRGGTPDMTLGRPNADQAGARPYQHHSRDHGPDMDGRAARVLSFFSLHTNDLTI
jgi:hypothetical protein